MIGDEKNQPQLTGVDTSSVDIETIDGGAEELSELPLRSEDFRLLERRNQELERELAVYRQMTEDLRTCKESFDIVIESLPYPFYVIDAQTYRIILANSAAKMGELSEESTCYAVTHQRSSPCDDIDHPCPLKVVRESKKPMCVEHVHFDAEGKLINVEVHAYPILDREGDLSRLIEYSFDITDRKQTERDLRTMENARVLAETAGAAAHEINQPLQAILTIASFLLREAAMGDPNRCRLEGIIQQAGRIREVICRMKNIQRYATTPYMSDFRIVDFHRSCLKDEGER
jgi:PAS domain-containing protein